MDNGVYALGKATAIVLQQSPLSHNYELLKKHAESANKLSAFNGVALSMFDYKNVCEGQVCTLNTTCTLIEQHVSSIEGLYPIVYLATLM